MAIDLDAVGLGLAMDRGNASAIRAGTSAAASDPATASTGNGTSHGTTATHRDRPRRGHGRSGGRALQPGRWLEGGGVAPIFQELEPHLGEEGIDQDIVHHRRGQVDALVPGQPLQFEGEAVHFRAQLVRRPAGDGLLAFLEHPGLELGVDRGRGGTVLPAQDAGGLLGDGLIPLPGQDVEHRLGADDLGGGGDQGEVAQVLAHPGDLRQDLVEAGAGPLFLELALHVGEHATRDLGDQDARVDALQGALELGVLLAYLPEVGGDTLQALEVQPGIPRRALEDGDHRLGGRMAVGHAHGGDGGVDHVDPRLRRLEDGGGAHAGGGVALHGDG